jgi:hypothetical protein
MYKVEKKKTDLKIKDLKGKRGEEIGDIHNKVLSDFIATDLTSAQLVEILTNAKNLRIDEQDIRDKASLDEKIGVFTELLGQG